MTIQNPKHNISKSMVGPWPLAPHHDYLQYIHHIHLMQRDQNRGVTLCSKAVTLRAYYNIYMYVSKLEINEI